MASRYFPVRIFKNPFRRERSSDDKKSFSTSKLARRLKNPRKRKDDVCVGDEVSFVWEKQRVTGVVRFVGKTDFSAGTWCGAELDNPIGKNDGTVKGHTYFECPENHGVFVPLQKVKLVPRFTKSVPNLLEDSAVPGKRSASISHIPDEDMRIVVKSVSVNGVTPQPTKIPTKTFRQEKGPVESTPRVERNVVVSSFTTPTPRKAVFAGLLDDLQYKQDFIKNNKQSTEESPTVSIEIPSPENFDKSVFAKLLEERLGVSSREEDPDITQFLGTSEKVEEKDSTRDKEINTRKDNENDSTREKENESTKDEQREETEEEEKLHFSRRDKSRNSSKIPRKSSSAKDHEHLRKSSVKINSSSNVEASPLKFVSSNAKLPIKINSFKSPKVEPPKSPLKITKSPVRTPSRVEATKVFFQEKSSIPKPSNILRMHKMSGSVDFSGNNKKPTKRSNKEVTNNQQGDANDVPSVVMGNNNTAQTPDVTSFPNDPNDNKQRIAARTSITRFSPEKRAKRCEYADLLNQLKERNERITHMEETIEQAKVTSAETSGKLNKELEEKGSAVADLQTKLNKNKNQLNKTSESVVALAVVLQYYLAQVNQVTTLLNNAITEKDKLELKNKKLQALGEEKNEEIKELKAEVANEKVISEAYRDEISQKEKEYKHEVSRIEKENKKELEILNKSHENRLQEFSDKVRSQHENDVKELNEWHDLEVRKILEKHERQIEDFENIKSNEMESLNILHEETMKEKENEIEELTTTHQNESTDFQGRLDELKNENSILEVRINNISKETEKEARMQALLAPYKLLPAELESLKSVLELKNEEVKNLRVKNMQLERKMELYYELQTKYEILELSNQSLTENLKKKQITEQNISSERDLLMEKFEREHRKCSQLSLANEELVWKASNPDLSFSTPNIYEAAEEPECSTPVRTASLPQSAMKNMKRRSMNFPLSRTDYNEL